MERIKKLPMLGTAKVGYISDNLVMETVHIKWTETRSNNIYKEVKWKHKICHTSSRKCKGNNTKSQSSRYSRDNIYID